MSHWQGEPVRVWKELWSVPQFEAWSSIGSTNDRVRDLAKEGAGAFTTVVADAQTAGRGRGGRPWVSPAGRGLWMSVLLHLEDERARRLVPLHLGLAVCRAVERLTEGVTLRLKWPNDVLLADRKLAGVLCETEGDGVVIAGVGVNVSTTSSDLSEELVGRVASLANVRGGAPSRAELAGALLGEARRLLQDGAGQGALDEVRARDALRDRAVEVGAVRGVAAGIDDEGRLLLDVAGGGLQPVVGGTVRLLL